MVILSVTHGTCVSTGAEARKTSYRFLCEMLVLQQETTMRPEESICMYALTSVYEAAVKMLLAMMAAIATQSAAMSSTPARMLPAAIKTHDALPRARARQTMAPIQSQAKRTVRDAPGWYGSQQQELGKQGEQRGGTPQHEEHGHTN